MRRTLAVLAVAVAVAEAVSPAPARAQGWLERADSFAAAGRADEAREALLAWWEHEGAAAPRPALQRALWLRGLLTVDPGQATLDFQRLVVEYPGGPHTDGALLRLAQAERAAGRPGRAVEHLRTLVRDYPSSPQRLRARTLLSDVEAEAAQVARADAAAARAEGPPARAGAPEAGNEEPATRVTEPDAGETRVTEPDAAGTRAAEAAARATGAAEARTAEPAPREPATPPRDPRPVAPAGAFSVQLGAFSTVERARDLFGRARAAGLEPRLVRVPGSALVRVRADRFLAREEAERRLAQIRAGGFDALVVVDADREEDVP